MDWWGTSRSKARPVKLVRPVRPYTKKVVAKIPKQRLNWPQAAVRYPRMNPFGDSDHDGKLNMFDCKPLNKNRHGKFVQNIPISEAKQVALYHGTSEDAAKRIIKEGLVPSKVISRWKKRVYLTPDKEYADAYQYGHDAMIKANVPIKQIKIEAGKMKAKDITKGSYVRELALKKVVPEQLKYLKGKELKKFQREVYREHAKVHHQGMPESMWREKAFEGLESKQSKAAASSEDKI